MKQNKLFKQLGGVFEKTLSATGYLGGMLLMALMFILSFEVMMRFFFNRPTVWVNPISGYITYVVTIMAAAWILKEDGHVSIDIVITQLGPKAKGVTNLVTSLVGLLACCITLWKSAEAAWQSYKSGYLIMRGIMVPQHIMFWFFVFGMLLLCIQFALKVKNHLVFLIRGNTYKPEH